MVGWASGGDVFDAVGGVTLEQVAHERMTETAAFALNVALIRALQKRGWDTEGESQGEFDGYWYFDDAFEACGIVPGGGGDE